MSVDKLKKEVKDWSVGFKVNGDTQQELIESLNSIRLTLINEIEESVSIFDADIKN